MRRSVLERIFPWIALLLGAPLLLVLRNLIDRLPAEALLRPTLDVWLRVWVFGCLALGALALYRLRAKRYAAGLLAVLMGLCLAGMLLFALGDTSFALNGAGGDQGLVTAQITHFTHNWELSDFAYKDLPAYYPPLYYYLLGRAADAFGVAPYRMVKYGLLLVAYLLPFLTQRLWSRLLPGLLSLAPALSVLLYQNWYRPAEWLSLLLFLPWWLHFVEGIDWNREASGWQRIVTGSLLGAALFSTYFYWFLIAGLSLLLGLAARRIFDVQLPALRQKLPVLAGAALFSVPYWGPYLLSLLTTPQASAQQNRYFIQDFVRLELPFLALSLLGLVLLLGLIYLLRNFREQRLAMGLLLLLLSAYAWQLLGYPFFLLDAPLLTFKARDFVVVLLGTAALLTFFEYGRVGSQDESELSGQRDLMVAGMLILLLFFGQKLADDLAQHDLLANARSASYPQDLITNIQQAMEEDINGQVVLAEHPGSQLSIFLPVYQFLPWAEHYSHPAGLYGQRVELLRQLSTVKDPLWFSAALMNNRYTHIDVLLLLPVDGGYSFSYREDNFPNGSETERLFFAQELFDPTYFERREIAPFVAFIPRYANDPLAGFDLNADQMDATTRFGELGDADDMLAFLELFGQHLALPGQSNLLPALQDAVGASP